MKIWLYIKDYRFLHFFPLVFTLLIVTKIKLMTVCCVDYSEHGGCRLWVSLCQVRREESSRSERTSGTNCFVLELELKGVELRSSCFRHPTPLCTPVFPWSSAPSQHWYRVVVEINSVCKLFYSITHCCAWPAEGRSILHIERSWPAIQAAPTDRPLSSSTCCSQFLRGRPGGRFQSAAGGVPVWASIDSCSACEAS